MADDEIDAMAVHFGGMKPDTGEIVSIGTLLLHPSGDAMVMGPDPDREISLEVILRCMDAAHHMCCQLVDDAPQEERVLRFAVRAVLYQILVRLNPPGDAIANETLQ
jgi:hypothetical protein